MIKLKNIVWVRTLMIMSQVLLTAFVAQWLYSQYNQEKEELSKNLSRQFSETKQQIIDSALVNSLISPAMYNKKGVKIRLKIDSDSISTSTPHTKTKQLAFFSNVILRDSICSGDSVHEEIKQIDMKGDSSSNSLLLSGVRLIIKSIAGMPGEMDKMEKDVALKIDSSLFLKIFTKKLERNGWNFPLDWTIKKNADPLNNDPSRMYFESKIYAKTYGVEISQYFGYVIKKIVPQLLFAVVLLLLTSVAFRIAYVSLKEQLRLSMLKNDFISNISHELKTPVATVKVAIEALQKFNVIQDPALAGEYLEMARLETNRLDQLITSVLNTSVLEGNHAVVFPEDTDLRLLIEEVIKTMKPRFDQLQASITTEAKGNNFHSMVDPLHVQGVVINLLDNCLKYTPPPLAAKIAIEEIQEAITVTVSDNGSGIPPEYSGKVFDRFFRVPTGNRHNVKGYGLGLNYAKQVMQLHNGTITMRNLPEGGCAFTLTFPVQRT